jgi:hypothetical protein
MHMLGTRIEKEVEIYATNLVSKTKCVSTSAWRKKIIFLRILDDGQSSRTE